MCIRQCIWAKGHSLTSTGCRLLREVDNKHIAHLVLGPQSLKGGNLVSAGVEHAPGVDVVTWTYLKRIIIAVEEYLHIVFIVKILM